MTDNLITNTDTIFGGSQFENAINQSLVQINDKNSSIGKTLNLQGVNVTGSDPVVNQNFVTLRYANEHYTGGQGGDKPLNQINSEYPLTNNLDIRTSGFTIRGNDPLQPSDMAIKSWTEDQINNYTPVAIESLGDPTTRTQMAQTGRFTYFQGSLKEELRNGYTKTYQPLIADGNYQITDVNQYVTYSQAVASADSKIEEEKQARISADNNLQSQITTLHDTPLNLWPTPMTPGIEMNTFEMNGNQISGLGMQVLNTMPGDYASSIDYVNTSVNTLATNVVGQIANVKVQCNSYTDIEVGNLRTQTELDLAGKQDIVPLNEIPLPETALNMNAKRITNLAQPAFVDGDLDALPYGFAKTVFATKTELSDYITIQDANDAFRSRISTLSDIQQEEPAPLNMQNLRITNCANAVNPTDVPTYQQVIAGQGISQEYADTHYLAINIPLNEINAPTSVLSMNNQNIIDLPLIPSGLNNACSVQYATDLANQTVANPISDINMNLAHKITGLPIASQPSDAVRFDQLPDLNDYLTQSQADTLYMPKNESLSGIQNNNPQELDMQSQKITGLPIATQPSDAVRFDQLPAINPGDEIINSSGFSSVKVNQDQSISITSNNSEIISVQPTLVTINEPIFSTTSPAADPSNQLLTKSQLDAYYMPAGTVGDQIQNATQSAVVRTNNDGTISMNTNNSSDALVISSVNNNFKIANNNNIELQSNNIITLNASQYVQSTTPIIQNSNTPPSQFQLMNRTQNDARYYQNTTPLNSITGPNSDIAMGGYTLSNIRDAIDNLEPTNLAQVTSLIANSGFKNKIQSQSGHAQVLCQNGSDNILIKTNNATSSLQLSSDGINAYTLSNSGQLNINATNLNVNSNLIQMIGTGGQGTVSIAGDLRSSSLDLDFPDQILTREQNDARYLSSQTTNLSTIPPPDSSVSFGGQLLRNLQTPILGTDASTKAYIDSTLLNYPTSSQTDQKISTALVPYSTTTQIANTYLTQVNAQNTYQPQSTPFTSISSVDQLNKIVANQGLNGIDFFASNAGVTNKICTISQPSSYPQSCQIVSPSRLFLTSGSGQFSIYSGTGQKNNSIYIGSSADNISENNYDQIVIGNGRSTAPQLTLSSGHSNTNIPYSIICNSNTTALNNLQLSPEISANVLTGNALNMYSNALVSTFPILNQFTKPTGLSYAQTSVQGNEFLTKTKADSLYSGGGVQSYIQDSTTVNKVACSSSNVQVYTPLISGSPSLIFKQSSAFPTYLEMNPSNVIGGLYISYPNIILQVAPTCFTDQITAGNTQLIQKQYADSQYYAITTPLQSIVSPTANLSLNNNLITNLASGTIASGNTSSVTGGNVYDYISTLPSIITQQVYTVTIFGSTTNGFLFSSLPNTPQNNIVQVQRVKGAGSQMITSSTVIAQSQTLVDSFASLQFSVSNANIRVTQCVPYTTQAFSTPGQQNIASLTFSQQAINATNTCIQLYKPVSNQASSAFILYIYVDQF